MLSMRYLDGLASLALIVMCGASAIFLPPVLTFGIYIFTLALYVLLRYDSRMFVGTAIFLLVVCAALPTFGSESQVNQVAIWAFCFLVVGVLGLLIERLRERTRERNLQLKLEWQNEKQTHI